MEVFFFFFFFTKNVPGSESAHFHKMKHHKYSNTSRPSLSLSHSEYETADPRKSVLRLVVRPLHNIEDLNIDAFAFPFLCFAYISS